MKTMLLTSMIAIGCLGGGTIAQADLTASKIFSDHMVLQQGVSNTVWGWANPGALVTIQIEGQDPVQTTAQKDGRWEATLPPMKGGTTPLDITIESEGDRITIQDVLVGEVWFCSGQSNMQWRVQNCERFEEVQSDADRPTIRMFTVELASVNEPAVDVNGQWIVCTPETVGAFSGTAYHMGRTLSDRLDVPIGLVNSSWGGSSAEAWIGPERLSTVEPGQRVQKQFEELERERLMDRDQYADLDINDSHWLEGTVPGRSDTFGIPDDVDGIFWLRIPFEVPKQWTGRQLQLSLGMVDDDDITYFNGVEIGRTNGWRAPRQYDVPKELASPGPAMVAIRITDGAGPGGIHGEAESLYVHPVDDPEDRLSLAGPARMFVAAEVRNLPAQHKPSHLYNGMLHPLKDYSFAGAAWYQGENNAIGERRAEEYAQLLPLLINDWRDTMDHPRMPFLIVQLPNWDHKGGNWNYPRLREAQRQTHMAVPHTGLIVTTDIGDSEDIHPRNKHDVGDRLGRWALADVYGVSDVVQAGPIPRQISWFDDRVRIEFDTFGSPLAVRMSATTSDHDAIVSGFEISGPDGETTPVEARITSENVVTVMLPEAADSSTIIRYAWAPDPVEADLVNIEGLPASPFEWHRAADHQ